MLKKSVVLIPTIEPLNQVCDFVWQTSRLLANHNNYVYVVSFEGASSLKEILTGTFTKRKFKLVSTKNRVNYPHPVYLFPFRRFNFITQINQIAYLLILQLILKIKHSSANDYFLWMFFPHLDFLLKLKWPRWQTIYDIVDFHIFSNSDKQKKFLLKKADYIFAISQTLKRQYCYLTHKPIAIVPQGFSNKIFTQLLLTTDIKLPGDKPIIGFVGQLNERLDYKLLENLVIMNPNWKFVFVGPKNFKNIFSTKKLKKKINSLLSHQNVTWIKQVQKKQIPIIIDQFTIGIIPYDLDLSFNRYCYPMKLFEYFYLQKPVVATPIEELTLPRFKNLIKVGNSADEWSKKIKKILIKPWPQKYKQQQLNLAKSNSWKNKIAAISKHISHD